MKITRPNLDVVAFGSQAQAGERTVFGNESTVSDDLTVNISADFIRGWSGGLDANGFPPLEFFNGQMFTTSQLVSYLFQMGISEWNAEQFYPIHARSCDASGVVWRSLQENTGQPQVEGVYWTKDQQDIPLPTPVGHIELSPFRNNQLPEYRYFCNGDGWLLTSPQGIALDSLTDEYKADWGITDDGTTIYLPSLFHTDGRGFFIRAVDGSTRQVGSIEKDALQWEDGTINTGSSHFDGSTPQGPFGIGTSTTIFNSNSGTLSRSNTTFNLSRSSRVASETRAINKGMTPTIYLGV